MKRGNSGTCEERVLNLQHRDGRALSVRLRAYRLGDEKGIIACIRDEYVDTYFKQDFYIPEKIQAEVKSGHITFLVAEIMCPDSAKENGTIAGMLILKQFRPEECMCELASQIFRKKYRGYGLALPFFVYGMEILQSRDYTAAYCLPVLFHDTTQKLLYRLGMRATGFILNVFCMERITHSYVRDRNSKHSQGIQIMAQRKRDAGILYLPREHQDFCRGIYDSLGAAYFISGQGVVPDRRQQSDIAVVQNDRQSSLEIRIRHVAKDLRKRVQDIHQTYPLRGMQTSNIFLNINDGNAVWAYRLLQTMGYFFTGLRPLCGSREYMVLHNPGEVKMYLQDYSLTAEFRRLMDYVYGAMQKSMQQEETDKGESYNET